jgi:hypothetical protein
MKLILIRVLLYIHSKNALYKIKKNMIKIRKSNLTTNSTLSEDILLKSKIYLN